MLKPGCERLAASLLLVLLAPWSFSQEPASASLLEEVVFHYEASGDQPAVEASAEVSSGPAGQLAFTQAELSRWAEGLEAFRDPESSARLLKLAPKVFVPELARFFKDRDSALNALYRVLALADYTWAMRFPGAECEPALAREKLLAGRDGLFSDPASGALHDWVAKILEAGASGKEDSGALQASLEASLSAKEYESLRLRLRELVGALSSDEASGTARAGLYCERARLYERLAASHQRAGEILAGPEAGGSSEPAASSVLLVAVSSGSGHQALGAAVLVRSVKGTKVLTDASVILDPGTGLVRAGLVAFARPSKSGGPLEGPYPLDIERIDRHSDVAVGWLKGGEDIPGLELSNSEVSQGALLRAVGHGSATGGWTISQGLTTASDQRAYRSDALLGPDSAGSALLDDSGELVGLAVADDAGVHALQPEVLKEALEERPAPAIDASRELGPGFNQGSTAILTPARPFEASDYVSPSGSLVEAGLGSNLGGVAWDGGGRGTGGFRFRPSTSRSSSWGSSSWGSGSSYQSDTDSPAYQFGRRVGTAIREGVEKFLAWLFTPRPKAQFKPVVQAPRLPKPVKPPPPPPPPKPRIAGLSLTASPEALTAWGTVSLAAEVMLDQPDKPKSGLPVTFDAPQSWDIKFQGSSRDKTDSSGRATATVDIHKPKGPWKEEPIVFTARVSGAGEVQGSASASASVKPLVMPMITGFTLTSDSDVLAFGEPVSLTAVVSFNEAVRGKAGIPVRFEADPAQYARFGEAAGARPLEVHTDAEGRVELKVFLIEDERMREHRTTSGVHGRSRDAFAGLDAEAGKTRGGEAASAEQGDDPDQSETADVPAALPLPGRIARPPQRIIAPSAEGARHSATTRELKLTAAVVPPAGLATAPGVPLERSVQIEAGTPKGGAAGLPKPSKRVGQRRNRCTRACGPNQVAVPKESVAAPSGGATPPQSVSPPQGGAGGGLPEEEIEEGARKNKTGFKTIRKLLTDRRFDKP